MKTLNNAGRLSVLALGLLVAGASHAVPAFDAETGVGFVPKGDVQFTFGWNNALLQANADFIVFRVGSEVVSEVSWICTNENNDKTQERSRTTTTTVGGVFSTVGRMRNQITGFTLEGWDGEASSGEPVTEGNQLNSCPSGPWSLTTPAGDAEVVSEESAFQVSADGGVTWQALMWKVD